MGCKASLLIPTFVRFMFQFLANAPFVIIPSHPMPRYTIFTHTLTTHLSANDLTATSSHVSVMCACQLASTHVVPKTHPLPASLRQPTISPQSIFEVARIYKSLRSQHKLVSCYFYRWSRSAAYTIPDILSPSQLRPAPLPSAPLI